MTLGEFMSVNGTYRCPTRVYDLDGNRINCHATSRINYSKAEVVNFEVTEEFDQLALIVTINLGGHKQ